jgi:hypothetical protein
METKKYAKLAISYFKENGYYSEITEESLEELFNTYLNNLYDEKVKEIALKVNLDKNQGIEWSMDKYTEEINEINKEITHKYQELIRIKLEDLSF